MRKLKPHRTMIAGIIYIYSYRLVFTSLCCSLFLRHVYYIGLPRSSFQTITLWFVVVMDGFFSPTFLCRLQVVGNTSGLRWLIILLSFSSILNIFISFVVDSILFLSNSLCFDIGSVTLFSYSWQTARLHPLVESLHLFILLSLISLSLPISLSFFLFLAHSVPTSQSLSPYLHRSYTNYTI